MRLRNIPGAREVIAKSEYVVKEEPAEGVAVDDRYHKAGDKWVKEGARRVLGDWYVKGHWQEEFGNDHPVQVEIGMGKGTFIMRMAKAFPEINFVGIEKYSSVLLRAIQKQEEEKLSNVKFIRMDAEYIEDVFAEGEVDRIYLNFSDPWPKEKHAKRRLTSRQFLERYDKILKTDGIVEFKTDNDELFAFSLEAIPEAGWKIVSQTFDLHHNAAMNEGNIMTEYEERFSAQGNKIHKVVLCREPAQ
ncbi:MAG: tRNA (guanosine(46)-N7)-methyltransferase TrmB [Lachnospiraceae bacterium]|nr:tRNA (guanosine(46)-N7)-methyltransferase TrmB [Lachnospiraceae bacterium]MDO4733911.1 tRNA (guanosine(46)-N7)-methyltransferase TrmB [Lachnospiraceae bacterium]